MMLTVMNVPKQELWQQLFKDSYEDRSEVYADMVKCERLLLEFNQSVNSFHDSKEGARWEETYSHFYVFLLKRKGYLLELLENQFREPDRVRPDVKKFMENNSDLFGEFEKAQRHLEFCLLQIHQKAVVEGIPAPKTLPHDYKLETNYRNETIVIRF